jgi:NTP pyrophosphatase (non-canonical NTP hydrolase)
MKINELVRIAHRDAKKNGWVEEPRRPLEVCMLIMTEVAEAVECERSHFPPYFYDEATGKPEGELSEMADVVIRVADWCGENKWNLEKAIVEKLKYNRTRGYRHGGKKI